MVKRECRERGYLAVDCTAGRLGCVSGSKQRGLVVGVMRALTRALTVLPVVQEHGNVGVEGAAERLAVVEGVPAGREDER